MSILQEILMKKYDLEDGNILLGDIYVPIKVAVNHLNTLVSEVNNLQKENEELKKQLELAKNQEYHALTNPWRRKYGEVKSENEDLRADLLYFWTWIVGGYESRPETRLNVELEKMEERYEWLKGETK